VILDATAPESNKEIYRGRLFLRRAQNAKQQWAGRERGQLPHTKEAISIIEIFLFLM
jgi:hypothetical protein